MVLSSLVTSTFDDSSQSLLFNKFKQIDDENPATQIVTEQEFAKLQHQASRLEHLLQVMPAGVVVVNGKGLIKQANAQAKALLGEPLEGQQWRAIIARSFKPQADDGHEVSLIDGRKVKLSITPLVEEPGQLIVLTDLTETRILQQRISHMQRLSSLGKTVASVVHQIRTPLSAAILYAANLANKNITETAKASFSTKLQCRLQELESQVNDMLLFAKSGEQQVVQNITLGELLDDISNASENMITQSNTDFQITCNDRDLTVLGNKPALIGALQNLIHNGIQMQPQQPVIRITCQSESESICIAVADNGPGVDEQNLHRIFEPFFTSKSQGTGLGLSVVSTVAKSHGGSIRVENTSTAGAKFILELPVQRIDQSGETR